MVLAVIWGTIALVVVNCIAWTWTSWWNASIDGWQKDWTVVLEQACVSFRGMNLCF